MEIGVLSNYGACSSLILQGFDDSGYGFRIGKDVWDHKEFVRQLRSISYQDIYHEAMDEDYVFSSFAFIVASTNEWNQHVPDSLRKLGFTETVSQWNSKNDTTVQLWWITVPNFLEAIKEKTDV
jgi:hypothetical protein